jgi:hypothetical protein
MFKLIVKREEKIDRVYYDTGAYFIIWPFSVLNIDRDIFELILKRSRIYANSLAI